MNYIYIYIYIYIYKVFKSENTLFKIFRLTAFVSSSFMFITFFTTFFIYNFSIKNHIPLTIKY